MTGRTWQDMPEWLAFDVRACNAAAPGGRAGDDAVTALTDRILSEDPEFARALVARYVRGLVRAPKPRKEKKDRDRELLMGECVRLSADGLSLRAIGEAKGISRTKVARLLSEWQARLGGERAAASRASVTQSPVSVTPSRDTGPNVIPLRRLA